MKTDKWPHSPCRNKGELWAPPGLLQVAAGSCGFLIGLHVQLCRRWGGHRDTSLLQPDAGASFSGRTRKELGYYNPDSARQSTRGRINWLLLCKPWTLMLAPQTPHRQHRPVSSCVISCVTAPKSPLQLRARWAVVGRPGPFQGHSNLWHACWQDPKPPCHPLTISNWAESFLH